jgi:hypothetical protein
MLTRIWTMSMARPILTGLRGTKIMGSISYTLVTILGITLIFSRVQMFQIIQNSFKLLIELKIDNRKG